MLPKCGSKVLEGVRMEEVILEETLTRQELWYWFCNIDGIGHKKMSELLHYFNDVEWIYGAGSEELSLVKALTQRDIMNIIASRSLEQIKREYGEVARRGYEFISIEEERYPKKLRTLYDPPYGIYVNGMLPKEGVLSIAMVGARNCSEYGKEVAKYFGYHLAEAGAQVISGMARGIDGYSHEGALHANGYSLAVLGCGVDYCYPRENMDLYMKLEKQGGIMSELPLGTVPRAGNFPRRNRLISGMCDGVLVVEAKLQSGSLITVDQALEQGRDVFVIPGRITDVLSGGTNNLIKMGAEIVSSPQEILDYYADKYEEKRIEVKQEMLCRDPLLEEELTAEQRTVYYQLGLDPKHIDQIVEETKIPIPKLLSILVIMEVKGVISQPIKNYYTRSL